MEFLRNFGAMAILIAMLSVVVWREQQRRRQVSKCERRTRLLIEAIRRGTLSSELQ